MVAIDLSENCISNPFGADAEPGDWMDDDPREGAEINIQDMDKRNTLYKKGKNSFPCSRDPQTNE